jgi:hypothetical protein
LPIPSGLLTQNTIKGTSNVVGAHKTQQKQNILSTMNHHSHFRLDLEPYKIFDDSLTPDVARLQIRNERRSLMADDVKHSESPPYAHPFLKQVVRPYCSPISELDILVGRSRNAVNHQGNKRFRRIVSSFVPQYFEKDCRTTRCRLVLDIIAAIELSGGRFLKQSPCGCGRWVVIGQKEKRNKVGHALRDAASAARSHHQPNASTTRNAKHLPPPPLSVAKAEKESGLSLFEDHTIGVDFAVDLDLLILMS